MWRRYLDWISNLIGINRRAPKSPPSDEIHQENDSYLTKYSILIRQMKQRLDQAEKRLDQREEQYGLEHEAIIWALNKGMQDSNPPDEDRPKWWEDLTWAGGATLSAQYNFISHEIHWSPDDVSIKIDLTDVSDNGNSVAAASDITSGLENLFRRLGPPPDEIRTEGDPVPVAGDGGTAR